MQVYSPMLFTISCWVFAPTQAYHSVISNKQNRMKAKKHHWTDKRCSPCHKCAPG